MEKLIVKIVDPFGVSGEIKNALQKIYGDTAEVQDLSLGELDSLKGGDIFYFKLHLVNQKIINLEELIAQNGRPCLVFVISLPTEQLRNETEKAEMNPLVDGVFFRWEITGFEKVKKTIQQLKKKEIQSRKKVV